MKKSKWAVTQEKHLGCIVPTDGRSPDLAKIQGLVAMKESKNKRQVRRFVGGVIFCRKMWRNRSYVLAPLTALTGNATFMWSGTR